MEHVVAQSMALRASQRQPTTPSSAVDDFPVLTRALSQIHMDSLRLLTARTASTSPTAAAVQASALRLFATHGFDLDRLRRGVMSLDTAATFVDRPDRPLPPFRHPFWLAPRAADDARLALNKIICSAADDAIRQDAQTARDSLVFSLSALYPTPSRSPSHTPSRMTSMSPSPSPRGRYLKHIASPSVPLSSSRSRRLRSGARTSGANSSGSTPGASGRRASVGTPNANTPRLITGGPGSSTTTPGILGLSEMNGRPPPVAALPLPQQYVDAVRAIATHGEARSAPMLLHEAAVTSEDMNHFRLTLEIVARAARYAKTDCPPLPEMQVWAARTVLEDHFASRIPDMPRARTTNPREVITVIERLVDMASNVTSIHRQHPTSSNMRAFRTSTPRAPSTPSLRRTEEDPNSSNLPFHVPHRPSAWFCVYICLRCGAVEAAQILLERTSYAPGQFFSWFKDGQEEVRQAFAAQLQAAYSRSGNSRRGDDDEIQPNTDIDALGFGPLHDETMPFVPGCLTSMEQYQAAAQEYRNAALSSDDPYMRACYVLLMRLDLSTPASVGATDEDDAAAAVTDNTGRGVSRRSMTAGGVHERFSLYLSDSDFELVFPTVEDYLWLQLWLCRTQSETSVIDRLPHSSFVTLRDVRFQVRECGDAHFVDAEGHQQPLLYAFVLASTAQFAAAVQYLYEQPNEHWMHYAIHLGVALYHGRWIDGPDLEMSAAQAVDNQSMERMVGRYVERVALRDVSDAILYILALRSGQSVQRLVRRLVDSEACELDALVGRVGDDGDVLRVGALLGTIPIQNVGGTNNDNYKLTCGMSRAEIQTLSEDIAREHAHEAQLRREFVRAAQLYAVAGHLDRTADMRMRDAADQVHRLCSSRRAASLQAARSVLQKCNEQNTDSANTVTATGSSGTELRVSWHTMHSLRTLLDMAGAFEDYWTGRYAAAWARLRSVGVVPMHQDSIGQARKLVEALGYSMISQSDERERERERGRHRRRRSSGGSSIVASGSVSGGLGVGGGGSGGLGGSGRSGGDDDGIAGDKDLDLANESGGQQRRAQMVADCVIEMLKVALHISDYALESGSIRNAEDARAVRGGSGLSGDVGNGMLSTGGPRDDEFALPSVDEIKSVSAFAAMLQCGDQAVDERLMRIDRLMLSGSWV